MTSWPPVSSISSVIFSPLENIAVEIKDNCKIIDMHHRTLNQNLEGLTNDSSGEPVSSNYFSSGGQRDGLCQAIVNKNDMFSFLFHLSII
jgi:hypothetical protein